MLQPLLRRGVTVPSRASVAKSLSSGLQKKRPLVVASYDAIIHTVHGISVSRPRSQGHALLNIILIGLNNANLPIISPNDIFKSGHQC